MIDDPMATLVTSIAPAVHLIVTPPELPAYGLVLSTMATSSSPNDERTLVQLLTYNTALQGLHGLPQDLVDWLAPSLTVSSFLSRTPNADIVAVGFQELLPLYQGLAGFSGPVMKDLVEILDYVKPTALLGLSTIKVSLLSLCVYCYFTDVQIFCRAPSTRL